MKPPEFYSGREQTYAKHFFLEKYLERVAYNIFSFQKEFVYVDGFSGPWKSADEEFEDTSFAIAISQLRKIRDGLGQRGQNVRVRCVFNDNDPEAYKGLTQAVESIDDIEIKTFCSDFEHVIPEIVSYVGQSFSLTFIDPTGWTGIGLQPIRPLLELRGEVIINFMFDFVNRFLEDPRPEIAASRDPLFGGPGWENEVNERLDGGMGREDAILDMYRERLRLAGQFPHVTSTRILKPLADRSFFHLVYGTRHWKGLVEYRHVEKRVVNEQERVRASAKSAHRVNKTGQRELFASAADSPTGPSSFQQERDKQLYAGRAKVRDLISKLRSIKYEDLLGKLLEMPLVWESDVKEWIKEMRGANEIQIPEMTGRARTPKAGHTLIWKGPVS